MPRNPEEEQQYARSLSNIRRQIRAAEALYTSLIETATAAEKAAAGIALVLTADGRLIAHPDEEIPAGEAYVIRR